MKNQNLISSIYASLVLSACFIQGHSLPQSLQRFAINFAQLKKCLYYLQVFIWGICKEVRYSTHRRDQQWYWYWHKAGRKGGGRPSCHSSRAGSQIRAHSDQCYFWRNRTKPDRQDWRNWPEREDLIFLILNCIKKYMTQGEDPFSVRNVLYIGLKLFLAIAGSGSATEKSDNPVEVFQVANDKLA